MLAAHRYKMTHVLLPRRNEKDLEEIPPEVLQDLSFEFADSIPDALTILFPERNFGHSDEVPAAARAADPAAPLLHTPELPAVDAPSHQPAL